MTRHPAFLAILVGLTLVGCGGGADAESGASVSSPAPAAGSEGGEAGSTNVVATFSGTLADAVPIVIELDDADGGSLRYPGGPRADRPDTLSGCRAEGATITCRWTGTSRSGEARGGDLELTRREGGVDGRMRADSDESWATLRADAPRAE